VTDAVTGWEKERFFNNEKEGALLSSRKPQDVVVREMSAYHM
jgi:hypothetical protein